MKPVIYFLLFMFSLSIVVSYFVNGKVVNAPEPVAVLPESPWVFERARNKVGAELYAPCASCHMADGSGRSDGDVPRLAGQSEKILVNKLQKLRDGSSYLPVMFPFARSLTPEELLLVARYIAALPNINATHESELASNNGAYLKYENYCSACHGSVGQGNDTLLSPKLCGQHSQYLIRRMNEIKQNLRGDADLAMAAVLEAVEQESQIDIAQWLETVRCTDGQAVSKQVNVGDKK